VRFDGNVFIPQEPVNLPTDRELQADISISDEPLPEDFRPGSAAAILRVLREGPHVPPEYVDDLERAIAEGQTPPETSGVFDDLRKRGA
jgi:hypothetical protein